MANAASSQPKLNDDPMEGMAHSEAHYFNRYGYVKAAIAKCQGDDEADFFTATTTMVSSNSCLAPVRTLDVDM